MVIHVYYIQVYSWCNFTFMNIHDYSRHKTGIIHEYSRIYTMNIHELFYNIHELFMGQESRVIPFPFDYVLLSNDCYLRASFSAFFFAFFFIDNPVP